MRRKHRGAYAREEYSWQSKCRSWKNYSALKERERDEWKARAEKAEAERDALRVRMGAFEALAEDTWGYLKNIQVCNDKEIQMRNFFLERFQFAIDTKEPSC